MPGQATAYKIGEMKIQEIRQNREKALGLDFDLKKFHRHVLTCIGPIEMLEECVIEEEQLPFPDPKIEKIQNSIVMKTKGPKTLKTTASISSKPFVSNIILFLLLISLL